MPSVGLVVNPAAGRDIRRLTGSATVSDNYGKRQIARSVLAGVASVPGVDAVVMPDKAGLGQHAVEHGPEGLAARVLDAPVAGSSEDTQRVATWFSREVDVVVVLGGDGTTRDVALESGDVPIAAVSTGTNNVVPTHVDGTAAGMAAGLLAAGRVPVDRVTYRHGMVEARVEGHTDARLRGLATLGVLDEPFVGTRAVRHGTDFRAGVVSRADPGDVGLSGIAGAVATHDPEAPGGVGLHLGPPGETPTVVRAITVPGVVERIGVHDHRVLADDEALRVSVGEGVLSVDGERDLEVVDADVSIAPEPAGPRIVRFDAVFATAAERGLLVER